MEFQKNDIVRLRKDKFEELREELWFKDNAFLITELKDDGMVALWELDHDMPKSGLLPMVINKRQAGRIYYDPIIAASFIGPGDEIPVHRTDYTYFLDAFKNSKDEHGRTLYDLVEEQKLKYVHEVQHWLRERYGTDDLKIHHQLITSSEKLAMDLLGLRNELLTSGVSSYQYLYEMANMLYLKWLAFYDESAKEVWSRLVGANGDGLIEKYKKAIRATEQQTQIESDVTLSKAIKAVENSVRQQSSIAEVFDLLMQDNSQRKGNGVAQNMTPKVLSKLMVELLEPRLGEVWYDPAAGTFSTMVEIDRYLRNENHNYEHLANEQVAFQTKEALSGKEILKQVARIGHCNARFHGLWSDVKTGDSLTEIDYQQYDGIICEPPISVFSLAGQSQGERGSHGNKQLGFVELILNSLTPNRNSRAAILLPEGFLWNSQGLYQQMRCRLFEQFNLNTILRLPMGIYPNSSVSMCILFLNRQRFTTDYVLVYDMRSVKVKPEERNNISIFKDFISAYRDRVINDNSKWLSIEELKANEYKVNFENITEKEKERLESPKHYLMEANGIVKEMRSLLTKLEKEVDGLERI